jgi:pyrimidine-nucleoside phosphorylase
MKTLDDSIKLAQTMVAIGEGAGRRTVALITDMDTPLGLGIGNSIEVAESMDVLKGHGPADLTEVSLQLAANMLYLVGKGDLDECRKLAEKSIADGSAFETFCTMVKEQGGDDSVLRDYSKFAQAPFKAEIKAEEDGFITKMNAEAIGEMSVILGAGRETKESDIDFSAGLMLHKKYGDAVKKGDVLVTMYTSKETAFKGAEELYRKSVVIGGTAPAKEPLVYARVEKDKVEKF